MTEWWQYAQLIIAVILILIWVFTDHSKWPQINAQAKFEKKRGDINKDIRRSIK